MADSPWSGRWWRVPSRRWHPPAHAAVTFESRALELVNVARAAAAVAPVRLSAPVVSIAGDAPYDGCGYRVAGRATDMGPATNFSHTLLNSGARP